MSGMGGWMRAGLTMLGLTLLLGALAPARAEDGYDLWLRYRPIPAEARAPYEEAVRSLTPGGDTPTLGRVTAELSRGLSGLMGRAVPIIDRPGRGRCSTERRRALR